MLAVDNNRHRPAYATSHPPDPQSCVHSFCTSARPAAKQARMQSRLAQVFCFDLQQNCARRRRCLAIGVANSLAPVLRYFTHFGLMLTLLMKRTVHLLGPTIPTLFSRQVYCNIWENNIESSAQRASNKARAASGHGVSTFTVITSCLGRLITL